MRYRANAILLFLGFLATAVSAPAQEYHNPDLPSLLTKNDGTVVTTPGEWESRRDELLDVMGETFIGSFPEQTPGIIGSQVLSTTHPGDGSTRRNVRLTLDTPNQASFDMWVWTPPGEGPHPLLLTAPRYYQIGWAETALSRGYTVCLYPGVDSNHNEPAYPNYQNVWQTFHNEYPGATWTEISTKSWIAGRALDHLLDPQAGYSVAEGQVGIIGFSRYGKQSMIAGAIDERFTSVVARSPGTPGSAPYRFASRTGFNEAPSDWPGEWFLQSLRSYTGRENELSMDAHAWAALIAPRNLLIHTAHNDDSDPTFGVERAYVEGSKVYELLGAENHYRVDYRTGGHSTGPSHITQAQQDRNIDWLDVSFGRGTATRNDFPQEYIHRFDWNAWQSQLTPQEKQNPFAGTAPANNADRLARINWAMGQAPPKVPYGGQYTFLTSEESEMLGHDRWQVAGTARTPVSFGDNVRGNLYYNTDQSSPAPVVIWLHPYSYPTGYNEGYGVEGTTVYHRLAAAGYTVLAFDQVGFGLRLLEGRDFYDDDPKWSRLGQMVRDVQAGVDFLVDGEGAVQGTMPNIDPEQIHVLGYSLGGMVGLYSAAMDERIKSVASFSGFTPMRTDTSDKSTGGIERLWDWHALQPMLGLFDGEEEQIPYDFEDVMALVAPRPVLVYSPQNNRNADFDEVTACVDSARAFWEQAGVGERLTQLSPDDISRLQSAQQSAYIQWLSSVPEVEITGTYVDADAGNTTSDTSPWNSGATNSDTDDLWYGYTGLPQFPAEEGDWYASQSDTSEDSPLLKTTITGLTSGANYNIEVIYMGHNNIQWDIEAGLASDSLSRFYRGDGVSGETLEGPNEAGNISYQMLAFVGVATADGSGNIVVYIDDAAGVGGRTWYDGVSYQLIPMPGDADSDGDVDSDDVSILAANWQSTDADWSMGDFNGDNMVDDIDATMLAANWHSGVAGTGSASNASIPEPNSIVLMLIGACLIALRR